MLSRDLQNCLVYAARYAHARQTGASLQVVTAVLNSWGELSPDIKQQLKKEAANEAVFNYEDWKKIINKD